MKFVQFVVAAVFSLGLCAQTSAHKSSECASPTEMLLISGGNHQPFMAGKDTLIRVEEFLMDKYPVTNAQFQEFINTHPKWSRKNIKPLFADASYLEHWKTGLNESELQSPVTNVSWYAANAYCECQGKRLPSIYEWEYAGSFDVYDPESGNKNNPDEVVLNWYSSPNPVVYPAVQNSLKNEAGLYGMHGLIWEWVHDFNSVMLPNDARNKKELEKFYCAAGALGAADPSDYASFLRFGLRSSLKANYTLKNLGFRCVKDKP